MPITNPDALHSEVQPVSPVLIPSKKRRSDHTVSNTVHPVIRLLSQPQSVPSSAEIATLETRLGRDLPGTPSVLMSGNEDGRVHIRFGLKRPHPNYPGSKQEILVGKFTFFDDGKMFLDAVRIPDQGNLQKNGWGTTFTRNLMEEAQDSNVSRIVMRTEKVGSYFWLKCGGEVTPGSRFSPNAWVISDAPEEVRKRYQAHMREKDYWGIADLSHEGKKYGFLLTDDIEWEGFVDLKNPRALHRMSAYLGMQLERPMAQRRKHPSHRNDYKT